MGRIGFVVSGFLSMVCAVFLAAALADGSSVVVPKHGRQPGVGVFYDSSRYEWRDSKNPLESLGCDDHVRLGKTVKAFSLIAIILSGFAVLTSLLGAATGKGLFGLVTAGMSGVMFLSFLIAMSAGWAIYDKEYDCSMGELQVKDDFQLNYGLFFLLTGTVASLINIGALVATGALQDDVAPSTTEPVEAPKEAA